MRMEQRDKRRVVAATTISLLIHFLGVMVISLLLAFRHIPEPVPPKPEPEVVEITVLPAPPPPPQQQFIETPEELMAERPPEEPVFESNADSLAASELPPTGDLSAPAQDGRETDRVELSDRIYTPGEEPRPAMPVPASPPVPTQPVTSQRPTPVERKPQSEPTPPPEALVILPPKPTPPPDEKEEEQQQEAEQSVLPQQPLPARQPSLPGYQREQQRTKIEGSIDSRGRASVAAIGTPLGRYKKQLSDAIGSRWYYYTTTNLDKISIGTAKVRFFVSEDGKVEDLEIVSNTSNTIFGTYTLQAILEAEIPELPPDIAATLENNRLEVEYSFTIYAGR